MHLRTTIATAAIVVAAATPRAQAQDIPPIELGLRGGIIGYQGDLQSVPLTPYGTRLALGAFARYAFAPKFAGRLLVEGGTLAATDLDAANESRRARGFSFEAPLFTIEGTVEWLPFRRTSGLGLGSGYTRFNPYVFAGVGYTHADAQVRVNGAEDQNTFPELGDHADFLAIPVGGGLRYDFPVGLAVGGEIAGRSVVSDFLDGISANAGPTLDDYYWTGVVWVSYQLGSGGGRGQGCPVW